MSQAQKYKAQGRRAEAHAKHLGTIAANRLRKAVRLEYQQLVGPITLCGSLLTTHVVVFGRSVVFAVPVDANACRMREILRARLALEAAARRRSR